MHQIIPYMNGRIKDKKTELFNNKTDFFRLNPVRIESFTASEVSLFLSFACSLCFVGSHIHRKRTRIRQHTVCSYCSKVLRWVARHINVFVWLRLSRARSHMCALNTWSCYFGIWYTRFAQLYYMLASSRFFFCPFKQINLYDLSYSNE